MSGHIQVIKDEVVSDLAADSNIEELQDIWTNAYGCWINPAPFVSEARKLEKPDNYNVDHTPKQIGFNATKVTQKLEKTSKVESDLLIYMRPVNKSRSLLPFYCKDTWPIKYFRNKVLYAFSATDPMGIATTDQKNKIANEALERKIKDLASELNNENVCTGHQPSEHSAEHRMERTLALEWWHGIGFMSKTWKEHGFVLMFDNNCLSQHNDSAFDIVYKLATEFKQGAVYEYRLVGTNEINDDMLGGGDVAQCKTCPDNVSVTNTYVLKRCTRGVCMDVTPEETTMELVSKPEFLP